MNTDDGGPSAAVLIVLGSGFRPYREYILRTVSQHYRLWLLDTREPTWQREYVVGATRVDFEDPDSTLDAARAVTRRLPVAGVFTYDESRVHACALLSEGLGLPTSPPETIRACRDKAATRAAMRSAGIPQPASHVVASAEQARAAAEAIGYPVIVKARQMAASFGIVLADGPDTIHAAYETADTATFPGMPRREDGNVLVEELLVGPEISVDAVVVDGEVMPTVLAHKHIGPAPYFEEIGHDVDAADPLLTDPELTDQLRRVHRALGFVHGATHTEFRLTAAGPRLIEVNARLGGDLIPHLGLLATGTDPVLAAARVAAGQSPDVTPRQRRAAAVRFLYPDAPCEVADVVVHEDRLGPSVRETVVTVDPGRRLGLPPETYMSRYGHVVAAAETRAEVLADLAAADELIELVPVRVTTPT